MATDVDVQFFSHLNGLTLSNTWGDMIRLLDTCLVNGLPLTSITSATVDAQGDINLTLFAAHNCLLFQIVELSGFAPSGFNGKYRIKGTPSATTLILKAEKAGQTITTTGTAKLASLGYEIKFRDVNDVKRAYRAIDPTDAHPFIRVDESLSGEGGGTYTSTYAKYAMVGLIENMTSIDDYADTNKLQLPLDTTDFKKNWKIVGASTSVVRGWSKWYWATDADAAAAGMAESNAQSVGSRAFTLCGNKDAFYLLNARSITTRFKILAGCGLINNAVEAINQPSWFLLSSSVIRAASQNLQNNTYSGGMPLAFSQLASQGLINPIYTSLTLKNSIINDFILPNYDSGRGKYSTKGAPSIEVPIVDSEEALRGSLQHIVYSGLDLSALTVTTPSIIGNSMYVCDAAPMLSNGAGGFAFYLGELE